jgi:hypothetical protein
MKHLKQKLSYTRHSGESRHPLPLGEGRLGALRPIRRIKIQDASHDDTTWIPAFAGMTGLVSEQNCSTLHCLNVPS